MNENDRYAMRADQEIARRFTIADGERNEPFKDYFSDPANPSVTVENHAMVPVHLLRWLVEQTKWQVMDKALMDYVRQQQKLGRATYWAVMHHDNSRVPRLVRFVPHDDHIAYFEEEGDTEGWVPKAISHILPIYPPQPPGV